LISAIARERLTVLQWLNGFTSFWISYYGEKCLPNICFEVSFGFIQRDDAISGIRVACELGYLNIFKLFYAYITYNFKHQISEDVWNNFAKNMVNLVSQTKSLEFIQFISTLPENKNTPSI